MSDQKNNEIQQDNNNNNNNTNNNDENSINLPTLKIKVKYNNSKEVFYVSPNDEIYQFKLIICAKFKIYNIKSLELSHSQVTMNNNMTAINTNTTNNLEKAKDQDLISDYFDTSLSEFVISARIKNQNLPLKEQISFLMVFNTLSKNISMKPTDKFVDLIDSILNTFKELKDSNAHSNKEKVLNNLNFKVMFESNNLCERIHEIKSNSLNEIFKKKSGNSNNTNNNNTSVASLTNTNSTFSSSNIQVVLIIVYNENNTNNNSVINTSRTIDNQNNTTNVHHINQQKQTKSK